jgi:hypothetical protein
MQEQDAGYAPVGREHWQGVCQLLRPYYDYDEVIGVLRPELLYYPYLRVRFLACRLVEQHQPVPSQLLQSRATSKQGNVLPRCREAPGVEAPEHAGTEDQDLYGRGPVIGGRPVAARSMTPRLFSSWTLSN